MRALPIPIRRLDHPPHPTRSFPAETLPCLLSRH